MEEKCYLQDLGVVVNTLIHPILQQGTGGPGHGEYALQTDGPRADIFARSWSLNQCISLLTELYTGDWKQGL